MDYIVNRYKCQSGYRYDAETQLYYLQSRYYNPDWGRFINADEVGILFEEQDSLLQYHLFAYCFNNPVSMDDQSGYGAERFIIKALPLIKKMIPTVTKNLKRGYLKATAKYVKLSSGKCTSQKLQHEFKHAGDFGIKGNWNKANGEAYQKAIQNHMANSSVYRSTYKGQDVYTYINSNTGLGAYTDLSGNYIGGWKFSVRQIKYHLTNGIKIR